MGMTRFQQYNSEPPAPSKGKGLASVLTGKHRQHLPCFRVDPRLMNPCQDVSERSTPDSWKSRKSRRSMSLG